MSVAIQDLVQKELDEYAARWKVAGKKLFDAILERGYVAYMVATRHDKHYQAWCKSVNTSRQGANNYKNVWLHFKDLDPATADKFYNRALYEVASIADPIMRQGALNWALEWSGADYVDYQLAYLSNPDKTPPYIRAAFTEQKMSKPQAYDLALAINRCPPLLQTVLIKCEVQWSAVASYILEAYKKQDDTYEEALEGRFESIQGGGESGAWAFCWYTQGGLEFEVPIGAATPATVEAYRAFRRWLRYEAIRAAQAAAFDEQYITGSISLKARVIDNQITLELPPALNAAIEKDEIEIEIEYKVRRRNVKL